MKSLPQGAGVPFLLVLLFGLAACGDDVECSLTDPCPLGSYCDRGECLSECDSTVDCAVGICTRDGRCARDQPDPDAGVCAAKVLEAEFGTPTVVLLVDQSGSMDEPYSGSTRWNVLQAALIDLTDGVVTRRQDTIRFGLTLYTGPGVPNDPGCPTLTVVDPAINNRDAIAAVYGSNLPASDTPTGESIEAVADALVAYPEQGPRYIILATDGEPDTCAEPNPQNGQPESVAAAQDAFTAGVRLFILSVGTGTVSAEHMQDVANAGIGLPVDGTQNAPYWEAGDATQLAEAFDTITTSLLSCDITVNGVIEDDAASSGVIFLDGNRLQLDDPDGWIRLDGSSFRLQGEACANAKREGEHTITAEFGCENTESNELSAEGGGLIDPGCAASRPTFSIVLVFAMLSLGLTRRRRDR